jgi:predicted aldo/keto reductase-like oxidoreductase
VFVDGVRELYDTCREQNVGLVGMKPYDGGTLLVLDGERTGITPVQCLAYALDLPLSVTLPGPKNADEMAAALRFVSASDAEKDYDGVVDGILQAFRGHCVYCNHCLPCPAGIDIGQVLHVKDWAKGGHDMSQWYQGLGANASDCVACGDCIERCPFGVAVIEQMEEAVEVLGP